LPLRRADALLAALLILVLPWLLLWPAPLVFASRPLSAPDQEAVQHLWGLWAAWQAGDWLVVTTDRISWPTGFTFVLIDPGNLPWFALGSTLGPVAGYNTVLLAGVALCGVAGLVLTRAAGGDGPGQVLGAVAGMANPALLSNAGEGITESFSVGWVGIAAGALLLALRSEGRAAVGWGAASSFGIAAAVWGGPYNAFWAALVCTAIGLAHLPSWRRLTAITLGGVLGALPAILAQARERVDGLPGTASRARWVRPTLDPEVWRGGNLAGADLLDPWIPDVVGGAAPSGHSAYLGLVALGLAIYAVARDRSRWPWLAGALAFVAISFGLYLSVGGRLLEIGGGMLLAPMGFAAKALPPLLRLTRWYRAAAVAGLLLAPLVAVALQRRRGLIGALLVLDACLLAPRAWPVVTFDGRPSPVWGALDEPGAVVELPPVQWAFVPEGGVRDANLMQQAWHGRPNSGTFFNLSGGAASSKEVTALMYVAIGKGAAGEAPERLAGMGYDYVVVDRTRFEDLAETSLEAALGPPLVADRQYVVYALPDAKGTVKPDFPAWFSPLPPPGGSPAPNGPERPAARR
jgi:hypothetical protein